MIPDYDSSTISIINLNEAQLHESTYAVEVFNHIRINVHGNPLSSLQTSDYINITDSNANLQTTIHSKYEKYIDDGLNHSISSFDDILQVYVITYGVKGYHNDVSTSVWDKVYELQNDTLEFQTPVKMTKELIIQNAVYENNPITKKTFDDAVMSRFYYCNNLAHNK